MPVTPTVSNWASFCRSVNVVRNWVQESADCVAAAGADVAGGAEVASGATDVLATGLCSTDPSLLLHAAARMTVAASTEDILRIRMISDATGLECRHILPVLHCRKSSPWHVT
ncbi:hypothetical protein GCM10007304_04350 [Rhodococcoides trifolii]|uniref:Uncharacterized protein n=1 Tax=Rhodococcoides trifolii TaxID=908250 RepID=A0A917FMD3_9NOCA|nr:hypothetical protein GCM10007304_04350 [Rhodococcus trifolii]